MNNLLTQLGDWLEELRRLRAPEPPRTDDAEAMRQVLADQAELWRRLLDRLPTAAADEEGGEDERAPGGAFSAGPGLMVQEDPFGVSISLAARRKRARLMARPGGRGQGFWAALGTGTSDGDNRWSYPFTERVKTAAGYDGWTAKTDGRSGAARNACEDANSASGVQGNGVDADNLDTADFTFTIQKAPAGSIVWIVPVTFTPEGGERTTEYWFWHENGVDGSCD